MLMAGIFALAGGDEFRKAYEGPDQKLLALLPPGVGPIVIVPTAAAHEGPERAIINGLRHFRALTPTIPVEGALVVDANTANEPGLVGQIRAAGMVYLTGGDPWHLVESLRGSATLEALRSVLDRGGIVAGSSAGAMALCAWMRRRGGGWQEGLGLVPGLAVIPHHGDAPGNLQSMRGTLPAEVAVLGIPTGVNCVGQQSAAPSVSSMQWRVFGARPVTIYRASGVAQAREGQGFVV
jgi:cyanophycinase